MSVSQLRKDKKIAYKKQDHKEVAAICNALGRQLQESGDYEAALAEHQEEASLLEDLKDTIGVGVAYRRMGEVYGERQMWEEALDHQQKYLSLAKQCEDLVEQQRAYATLGRTHMQRAELAALEEDKENQLKSNRESESAFLKALTICDQIHDKVDAKELGQMRCRIYHNIGLILDIKGDILGAIKFVSQGLEICNRYDLYEDVYRSYSELSRMHMKTDKTSMSLDEAKQALNVGVKLQSKRLIVDSHLLIGQVNLVNDDFNAAKKSFYKAYKIKHPDSESKELVSSSLKRTILLCNNRNQLSDEDTTDEMRLKFLDKMGDALVFLGFYKQAIVFYEKRLNLAIEMNKNETFLAPVYTSLAQTYQDANEYDKALYYFEKELEIHVKGNPKEAVITLIELAKISEIINEKDENFDKMLSYIDRALRVTEEHNMPQLKLLVLRTFVDKKNIPLYKMKLFANELNELEMTCDDPLKENPMESSESESDSDIDLDAYEFSDSDEECTTNLKTRLRTGRTFKLKANLTGESPLHIAVIKGNNNQVKKLLQQNHPVNVRDNCGWLPIHEACNWGHTDIVEMLIAGGAWINDRGGKECSGTSPLHDACSNGHFDVVRLLLESGASTWVKDDHGQTPLDCLIHYGTREDITGEQISNLVQIEEILLNKMEKAGFSGLNGIKKKISKMHDKFKNQNALESPYKPNSLYDTNDCPSDEESPVAIESTDDICVAPTDQYKFAIENVGSLRRKKENIEVPALPKRNKVDSLICEDEYVNENWLIDDLNGSKKRKRPVGTFELEYKENKRSSNVLRDKKRKKKQIKLTPFVTTSENKNDFDKSKYNFLDDDDIEDIISMTENVSSKNTPVLKNLNSNITSFKPVNSKPHLSLHVKVLNKKLLIPVSAVENTIGWLEEEVSRRYSQIAGVKLRLKLSTINDEILNPEDLISSVFSPDNSELRASVIGVKESISLQERYKETCSQQSIQLSNDILTSLSDCQSSGKLDFSPFFLRAENDFRAIFGSILYQNIQVINFNSCRLEDHGMDLFIESLSSLEGLEQLELEACSLSSESFKALGEYLKSEQLFNKRLNSINLSFNDFSDSSFSDLSNILSFSYLLNLNLCSCGMVLVTDFTNSTFISNINTLNLDYNELSISILSKITGSCPFLINLSLENCIQAPNGSQTLSIGTCLSSLLGAGSESLLQSLNLASCNISDQDIDLLISYIYRCLSLKSLNLCRNSTLSSTAVTKLIGELEQNLHIPLANLSLHDIKSVKDDCNFNTRCSSLIQKKSSSSHPLTSLSMPFTDTAVQSVSDTWLKVYKDKSSTRVIKDVRYLCVKGVSSKF